MNGFWTQILPALTQRFEWGKDLAVKFSNEKAWEKGLREMIKGMDDDGFNLFLAQVVMVASSKQIMGVTLTEQIVFLKTLRK